MNLVTDNQTLVDLEFDKILEWCSKYALSKPTKERILNLVPQCDFDVLDERMDQVQQLKFIKEAEGGFPVLEFEELDIELRLLQIKNSVIPLDGILNIHQASCLMNSILEFFENSQNNYLVLEKVFDKTHKTLDIVEPIEKVIDASGQIKDTASIDLKIIRDAIEAPRNN